MRTKLRRGTKTANWPTAATGKEIEDRKLKKRDVFRLLARTYLEQGG